MYLRLLIDGEPSRAFRARALQLPAYPYQNPLK
jgi:hypothetical protein